MSVEEIVLVSVQRDYLTGQPEVYGYDTAEDTFDRAFMDVWAGAGVFRGPSALHHERRLAYRSGGVWLCIPTRGVDPDVWEERFTRALDLFLERMSAQQRRAAGIVDAEAVEEPLALTTGQKLLPPAGGTGDGR